VILPFPLGAAPAKGEHWYRNDAASRRVVARHGQIGQQADVGEENAARQIGVMAVRSHSKGEW